MSTHKLRRVFVWELPVRIYHWVNALAIVALCITGYLIGKPPALQFGGEAYERHIFGWIRFIHFASAYIFLFIFIYRIYWGFVGNKYADWKNFVPTNRKYFQEMWSVLRIDILQLKGKEHLSIGHNSLAGFVYFLTFFLFLIQCLTGFGLYAAMSQSWIAGLFAWVPGMFGGDNFLRQFHHITMWLFILFAMVHIHLVIYHDFVEGRGEISSMGGGWKFIEEEVFEDHGQEKTTAEAK